MGAVSARSRRRFSGVSPLPRKRADPASCTYTAQWMADSHVNTLRVDLGARSYPILIGDHLLDQAEVFERHVPGRDLLVVSNTTVAPLYLERLTAALGGRRRVEVILPDGESHKTLATVARILDVLVANRYPRDCTVVALGGGVVGDTAGFAAAC